ncbi:amino acid adenylation domain-containing protein [Wukongibacter sp. M2B1]|uniref:amino acid adenylation domain-containing protein n=1 Tax=Wukongibacter sp. M2B1 TaxID=3088895 RepID=UPI003D7BED76
MDSLNNYGLTHPQKRIWYVNEMNPDTIMHNLGGYMKILGEIDVDKMRETINLLIKSNDGLRLRFSKRKGEVTQRVCKYQREEIEFMDFSKYTEGEKLLDNWGKEVLEKPFNLDNDKLYYFAIYKLNEKEYGILLKIHHIISDGWSISLIQKQISSIYQSLLMGNYDINFETCSYTAFIEKEQKYLKSKRFYKNREFWMNKFESLPETMLTKSSNELAGKRKAFTLKEEKSLEIRKYLKDNKISLNTIFTAAMLIYFNKTRSVDDLIIGIPVFNRSGAADKSTIGMFTSSMPFRFQFEPNMKGLDVIEKINIEIKACFLNQKYPYDLLVKDLELRKKGYDNLFDICVNYYNTQNSKQLGDIPVFIEEAYCGQQGYSLQIIIKEWSDNNEIELCFDYKVSDYSDEDIELMHKYIMNITDRLIENSNQMIEDLSIADEEEKRRILMDFNDTKVEYPKEKTVIDLFEEQVKKNSETRALMFENDFLTYGELDKKVNKLANYLSKGGIESGDRVALMVSHSFELVIGILAIQKIGAAYIPIDSKYPPDRVEYMLKDSEAKLIYTDQPLKNIDFVGEIVKVDNEEIGLESTTFINLSRPNDLAYIIYTSGSTGKPKGVMIEHRGLTNYIWWANKNYLKDSQEIFALYSSISFDLTVTSIFTPLISGNMVAIYKDYGDEFILYKILRDNKATIIKLTPSHLTLIKDLSNEKSSVNRFIVGGENLTVRLAKEVTDSFKGNIEIYNEYGPTETVVGCMIYKFAPELDKGQSVAIGRPADNVQIFILDKNLNLAATNVEGEIYISGDGVARGYLNRPELTERSFVQIDSPMFKNKRMYKTGDLAKMLPNGNVEFVGRADNQVKIRGHRIELDEIKNTILNIEAIKDVIVKDIKDRNGKQVLCAYIVSDKEYDDIQMKSMLLKSIPNYMIPTYFMYIDKLPLTTNGKIDFKLLPSIPEDAVDHVKYRNETEKKFVQAVEKILKVKEPSMLSYFFQLGGDSIKAIQIVSELKNMGMELKIQDIMEKETLEHIAASIEIAQVDIPQDTVSGEIDRTPIVNWFFEQKFKDENYFNQSILFRCKESIDIGKMKIALKKIIEHHDSLRINYSSSTSKLFYNNDLLNEEIEIEYYDLTSYDSEFKEAEIKRIGQKIKGSFNINKGLLFKASIMKTEADEELLLLTAHHLIVDGVSWRIILDDLNAVWDQLSMGKSMELPLKTHSFKYWSEKLNKYSEKGFQEEFDYWKEALNNEAGLEVDFNKGEATINSTMTIFKELNEEFVGELRKKVNTYYSMELNEILIVALVLAVNKMTKRNEIAIEIERHGREAINEEIDVSRTIGWFTSMFPVYFEIDKVDLNSRIKSLKEKLRNVPNKGFNFGIIKYLNSELRENVPELVRFNYLGDFDNILESKFLEISNLDCGLDSSERNKLTALIDITAMIINRKLKISFTYSTNKFKSETIKLLLELYVEILEDILKHCSDKNEVEFTPSDFEAVDLCQEDLDMLFDM